MGPQAGAQWTGSSGFAGSWIHVQNQLLPKTHVTTMGNQGGCEITRENVGKACVWLAGGPGGAGAPVFRVGLPGPFRATAGSGRLPRLQGQEGHDPSASPRPVCRNVHNVRPPIYKPSGLSHTPPMAPALEQTASPALFSDGTTVSLT